MSPGVFWLLPLCLLESWAGLKKHPQVCVVCVCALVRLLAGCAHTAMERGGFPASPVGLVAALCSWGS